MLTMMARNGAGEAGACAGLRVIELGQGMAGSMPGMILADNGADVIKIEPPWGDWSRRQPGGRMWNRGKRSVVLDLRRPDDREQAARLARRRRRPDRVVPAGHRRPPRAGVGWAPPAQPPARVLLDLGVRAGDGVRGPARLRGRRRRRHRPHGGSGRAERRRALPGPAGPDLHQRPDRLVRRRPTGDPGHAGRPAGPVELTGAATGSRPASSRGSPPSSCARRWPEERTAAAQAATPELNAGIELCFMTAQCADGRYVQMCARQDAHFRAWLRRARAGGAPGRAAVPGVHRWAWRGRRTSKSWNPRSASGCARARGDEWMRVFIEEVDVGADPFLTPDEFLAHPQMVDNDRVVRIDDPDVGPCVQVGALAAFSLTPSRIARPLPGSGPTRSRCWPSWEPRRRTCRGRIRRGGRRRLRGRGRRGGCGRGSGGGGGRCGAAVRRCSRVRSTG